MRPLDSSSKPKARTTVLVGWKPFSRRDSMLDLQLPSGRKDNDQRDEDEQYADQSTLIIGASSTPDALTCGP